LPLETGSRQNSVLCCASAV